MNFTETLPGKSLVNSFNGVYNDNHSEFENQDLYHTRTYTNPSISEYYAEYLNDSDNGQSVIKEALQMYSKTVFGFGIFWTLCVIALCIFVFLAVTNTIPLIGAIFGILMALSFSIGVYLDFRKWEKDYV